MTTYLLKIKYGDVLRRVTVKQSAFGPDISFIKLEDTIREAFKISDFVITYTDKDDDVVTMAGDEDIRDALVVQRLNPLRLTVVASEPQRGRRPDRDNSPPRPSQPQQPQPDFLDLKNLFGNSLKMSQDTAKQTAQQLFQACEPLVKGAPSMVVSELMDAIMKLASSTHLGAATSSQQQSQPAAAGACSQGVRPSGVTRCFQTFPDVSPGFPPPLQLHPGPPFFWDAPRTETPAPAPAVFDGVDPAVSDGVTRIVEGTPADAPVLHRGVQCDVCGQLPILGIRYKALKKHDYDLCRTCFEKNGDINEYTKIEKPLWRPRHLHGFDGPTMRCPAMPAYYGGRPSFGMRGSHMHGHHGHHGGHHGRHGFFGGGGAHGPYGAKGDSRCGSAFGGKLDARFVQDVTIFDGTEFAPRMEFTKIWRLRNSGSFAWPKLTQLVHVGGDALGTVIAVGLALPEEGLAPDGEAEVSVDLVAPAKPGRYISHWRLVSPTGQKFGHRVWVLIQVVPSDEQSPQVLDSLMSSSQEDELMEYNTAEPQPMEDEAAVDPFPAAADLDILATNSRDAGEEVETATPEAVQYPEINMDALTLDAVVVDPAKTTQEENTAVENSELGNFSMVNMPTVTEVPVEQQAEDNTAGAPQVAFAVDTDEEPAEQLEKYLETKKPAEEESLEMTLGALESMGFKQRDLNEELLKKNDYDVQRTVDDLVMAAEWDPMLEELEEMGFYDTDMNRRLMFKNNGSVKRVVKELVQMYKDPKGKEQM